MTKHVSTVEMTTDIVSAFVSRSNVKRSMNLPDVVRLVRDTLTELVSGVAAVEAPAKAAPATPIRKSVAHDHLTCLEDGLKLRSLKQHLRVKHGLTPREYRAKWSCLPDSYPHGRAGHYTPRPGPSWPSRWGSVQLPQTAKKA